MLLKDILKKVVILQREELENIELGTKRTIIENIGLETKQIMILSGIRRCGKSTLLRQIMKNSKDFYYCNFEDRRIFGFELFDFERLKEAFEEEFGKRKIWFFDEIQNVPEWERFVRTMHDIGHKFIITGSNASLLSKELATKLTGRHLTYEIFPFSYQEMLKFKGQNPSEESLKDYMYKGGFPIFLKEEKIEILQEILDDIVEKDVISRYQLRTGKIIKQLAIYLLTNIGKEFSYSKLANVFDLSKTSLIEYIYYFENSYLIFLVPKFEFSYKKQIISPKKVYSIDTGLSNANSASLSEDKGRLLENLVFLELRRKYKNIFYYKGSKECDFIVKDRDKLILAVQVCYQLTEENKERELSGLKEAIDKLKIKDSLIITFNQEDKINGIEIKPAWKWISNSI